jgi:sigma-B regulation protein RsbU (phosphoserine phosphatase)
MRVLVAEDERITRASLVRQLEAWGHTVTACEDGEQAWARFGEGQHDLVITDWDMPRLSGVGLIQRIRAAAGARFVYVIMLTGRSDKSDLVSGIESGADDFVSKPFDREELRVRLLAGERIVRLERTLHAQNAELRTAGERMRSDLHAAARMQRAMLPRTNIVTPRVRTAWKYVPTDELGGDAIGLELIGDRYLVAYVADVSGHGVPAALLAVTAMHAMSPAAEGVGLVRNPSGHGEAAILQTPSWIVTELNRRFASSDNDGRFLTMIVCAIDTATGTLVFARAGHPLPLLLRAGKAVTLDEAGGCPIGIAESAEYQDVALPMQPGDRLVLFSDGVLEQMDPAARIEFGESRFLGLLLSHAQIPGEQVVDHAVEALSIWAGTTSYADDVSLVVIDWLG